MPPFVGDNRCLQLPGAGRLSEAWLSHQDPMTPRSKSLMSLMIAMDTGTTYPGLQRRQRANVPASYALQL
jgi:hypothetical protein